MATLLKVCERALRQIGAYGVGEEVNAEDYEVSYQAALDAIARLPDYGAGRKLVDVNQDTDADAVDDCRYVCSAGLTLTLPVAPKEADRIAIVPMGGTVTVARSGRSIAGLASDYAVTAPTTLIYRPDTANWVVVDNLAAIDEIPYTEAFTRDLSYIICKFIKDDFSEGMTPTLAANIASAETRFRAAFARPKQNNGDLPVSVLGPRLSRRYG